MEVAVIGARGSVGRSCLHELEAQGVSSIALRRSDPIPEQLCGIIIASEINDFEFDGTLVDCTRTFRNCELALPNVRATAHHRIRIPNCMASLIAQALHLAHVHCNIETIVATTMQSASGAGWRGVQALEKQCTEEIFRGTLNHNVLVHERAEQEERAIEEDLNTIFNCDVTATSFRVPVAVGHVASIRIETTSPIPNGLFKEERPLDPLSKVGSRVVSTGRVRIHENIADFIVCGDQLVCGTAIPAVALIIGS